jgi:hypothetical protein
MKYFCLLLSFAILVVEASSSGKDNIKKAVQKCEVTPSWKLKDLDFPKDVSDSQVKLVAFFKASCDFCRNQSVM